MKRHLCLIAIALTALLSGCAKNVVPKDFSEIKALKGAEKHAVNNIRIQGLKETALSLGAKAGLAWRSHNINVMLTKEKGYLNRVFNFNAMLLKNNVLPPVLGKADTTLNLASDNSLRTANKSYTIIKPPRFVTAPPHWRMYIWMNYKKPEKPDITLLPRDTVERDIWNRYIKMGWEQGVTQADQIFSVNLGRLKRDFEGMATYRKLLAQNMVTAPFVATTNLGITGNEQHMRIGDKILRITATSILNNDTHTWKPALSKKEAS